MCQQMEQFDSSGEENSRVWEQQQRNDEQHMTNIMLLHVPQLCFHIEIMLILLISAQFVMSKAKPLPHRQ